MAKKKNAAGFDGRKKKAPSISPFPTISAIAQTRSSTVPARGYALSGDSHGLVNSGGGGLEGWFSSSEGNMRVFTCMRQVDLQPN